MTDSKALATHTLNIEHLRNIDSQLTNIANQYEIEDVCPQEVVRKILPLMNELVVFSRRLTKSYRASSAHYEEILHINSKWRAFCAYYGGSVLPVSLRPDKSFSAFARKELGPKRNYILGKVVSTKMEKTIVVEVINGIIHPKYKKHGKKTKRYFVHDEWKRCHVGDTILAFETRPISKNKHHVYFDTVESSFK